MGDTNNMLSLLEALTQDNPDTVAQAMADEFRKRRIEKNKTREMIAEQSGVPVANIARFERQGLISLKNLIKLAMALGYTSEIRHVFSEPKYQTMGELKQIKRNMGKKKAHKL